MQTLAIISLITLPSSFLAGYYGMNFKVFTELDDVNGIQNFWIICGSKVF